MGKGILKFVSSVLGRSVPPPCFARKNNERGVVLLGSVFLVLFLSIMFGGIMLQSDMQLHEVDNRIDMHHAFYATETGIDQAIFELRRDQEWRPIDSDGDGVGDEVILRVDDNGDGLDDDDTVIGSYTLEVSIDTFVQGAFDNLMVLAKGRDADGRIEKAILARVQVANPARFLFSSLSDLRFAGGSNVDFDVLGQDIYFDLIPNSGETIEVNGDVLYLRDVIGEELEGQGLIFGDDPDGGKYEPEQADSITFPGVDLPRYRTAAEAEEDLGTGLGCVIDGNLNFELDNADTLCGPSGVTPEIIYVDGNVTVSGEFSNNMVVVASGDVIIDGDVTPADQPDGEPVFQIGLLADQDVIIPKSVKGDLTVEAFVMADGEGNSDGVFKAVGNKNGDLNFKGAISARGSEDVATAINLNAFSNRNYEFNSELSNNNLIPLTPLIANVVEWEERNPNRPFPNSPVDYTFNEDSNIL